MITAPHMYPFDKQRIGNTELKVTRLGLGCSGLGYSETDALAIQTFQKAVNFGINYFDSAPNYFRGKSETRLGKALSQYYGDDLVISTKVGWPHRTNMLIRTRRRFGVGPCPRPDYSRKGVQKSLNDSFQRLGVDAVDIVFIHDPMDYYNQAIDETYSTLAEFRDDGIIKAIGVGMNEWEMELRFAQEGDFDCFLLSGRYTLLEQGALTTFLPYCSSHNISVIIGGPYNSGVLAKPTCGTYKYKKAPNTVVAKTLKLNEICKKHDVPLKAAALQFVTAHPVVASVIPGTRDPYHQEENQKMMNVNIPMGLWADLIDEGLIDPNSPVPRERSVSRNDEIEALSTLPQKPIQLSTYSDISPS